MAQFTLRYAGADLEADGEALKQSDHVRVLSECGRNFLVEADESQLRLTLSEDQWIVSPATSVPPPVTPHPIVGKVRRPK